jgi:Haem-degrading
MPEDGSATPPHGQSRGEVDTAVLFKKPAQALEDAIDHSRCAAITARASPKCKNGLPVVVDGEVIGSIGESFATPEEDEEVAMECPPRLTAIGTSRYFQPLCASTDLFSQRTTLPSSFRCPRLRRAIAQKSRRSRLHPRKAMQRRVLMSGWGQWAGVVGSLMVRPVWAQLQKCRVRSGSYAWCQKGTFIACEFVKLKSRVGCALTGSRSACGVRQRRAETFGEPAGYRATLDRVARRGVRAR